MLKRCPLQEKTKEDELSGQIVQLKNDARRQADDSSMRRKTNASLTLETESLKSANQLLSSETDDRLSELEAKLVSEQQTNAASESDKQKVMLAKGKAETKHSTDLEAQTKLVELQKAPRSCQVDVQYEGKGAFQPVWLSLDANTLTFVELRPENVSDSVASPHLGVPRKASVSDCTIRKLNRKKRIGFEVRFAKKDTAGRKNAIISFDEDADLNKHILAFDAENVCAAWISILQERGAAVKQYRGPCEARMRIR